MTSDSALRRYFQHWGVSGRSADRRECAAATSSRLVLGGGGRSSSGSLATLAAMRPAHFHENPQPTLIAAAVPVPADRGVLLRRQSIHAIRFQHAAR